MEATQGTHSTSSPPAISNMHGVRSAHLTALLEPAVHKEPYKHISIIEELVLHFSKEEPGGLTTASFPGWW